MATGTARLVTTATVWNRTSAPLPLRPGMPNPQRVRTRRRRGGHREGSVTKPSTLSVKTGHLHGHDDGAGSTPARDRLVSVPRRSAPTPQPAGSRPRGSTDARFTDVSASHRTTAHPQVRSTSSSNTPMGTVSDLVGGVVIREAEALVPRRKGSWCRRSRSRRPASHRSRMV